MKTPVVAPCEGATPKYPAFLLLDGEAGAARHLCPLLRLPRRCHRPTAALDKAIVVAALHDTCRAHDYAFAINQSIPEQP